LWNEISDYSPDLVIHYTGFNDIFTGILGLEPGWNHPFIRESVLTATNDWNIILKLMRLHISTLLQNSQLYRLTKLTIARVQHKKIANELIKNNTYSNINEIAKIFAKNMFFSQQIASGLNIPLIILLQPSIFTEHKKLSEQEKIIYDDFNMQFPSSSTYFKNGYSRLASELEKQHTSFIDGSLIFRNQVEDLYYDTVHCSDSGNKIIADTLAQYIMSKNFIDR